MTRSPKDTVKADEYAPVFHTKMGLGTPSLTPASGASTIYALAVTVSASVPTPEQPGDAAGVELRFTIDGSSVSSASELFPTLGLTLTANTTLRVKAFHALYFSSAEASTFYHVELAARSSPVLPLALQPPSIMREVPEGTQLQIGRTGHGDLWWTLLPSLLPDCSSVSESQWQLYDYALLLSVPSSYTLCAYVKESGYQQSAISHAQLAVRPWTQPVSIVSNSNLSLSTQVAALTLSMASQSGAAIWFTLEPSRTNQSLCDAQVQAAAIAPNLTLAANDDWQRVVDKENGGGVQLAEKVRKRKEALAAGALERASHTSSTAHHLPIPPVSH